MGRKEGEARGQESGDDTDNVGGLVAIKTVLRTVLAKVDGDSNIMIVTINM